MRGLLRPCVTPIFVLVLAALITSNLKAEIEVFATFEAEVELGWVQGSEGVRFSASERFPAWGKNSLEVVFPNQGGTLTVSKVPADWRWQESLLVFVWSDETGTVGLKLEDASGGSFQQEFPLKKGVNHLQLRLDETGTVDRGNMQSVSVVTPKSCTLYLDYFAIDRYHPVLAERGRWDIVYKDEVVTPHVPWGRNLSTGSIKAFSLADVANGRGVIELAQRLEMEVQAVTIGRSPGINKWGFGDFYEQRSGGGEFWSDPYSLMHAYIASDLLYGPQYDVILWPGFHAWESYPQEIREEVRRRVEAGAGLVLFYPLSKSPPGEGLWSISPLVIAENRGGEFGTEAPSMDQSRWQPRGDHYITRGVPFEAFPWGHIGAVRSEVLGDVILESAEGNPVVAVRKIGKGRVVALGYPEKGMIPQVDKVFETGLHYPYHEYFWALVTRAVVWAAGHEPEAAIQSVARAGEGIEVTLGGSFDGATIEAAFGGAFGEKEGIVEAAAAGNGTRLRLPAPGNLPGGKHFVDIRLTRQGEILDWAATVMEKAAPVRIVGLMPSSDPIKVGDDVSAMLSLASPEPVEADVVVRLIDNYDRLVDEQKIKLTVTGEVSREIPLHSAGTLSHLARIEAEVSTGGLRVDRQAAEVFVIQPRRWDDYDIVMYRFGPDPMPGIWPEIDRQMRRLHVTTLSSYSLSHSKHANYNIQAQTRISGQESPDGPARDYYVAMKKAYADSHRKEGLVREYCMNDPAYHELVRRELKEKAGEWALLSPLSYYVYEEPSLTCYADDLDLCFSDHCMRSMRDWLKQEYAGLEALNRKWGTDFASWDDVVPDDTYEAQARGNFVSWSDHRTFMERTYADFFAFVLSELQKIDPEGMLLNSGTQVSGAHNGCDYSLINNFTRHLNAYDGGNQLDFHRSFNPDIKLSSGAGYGVLGKNVFYDFYSNLFKGSNGGAYIFWQYSTLDPDLSMSQSGLDMEEGFEELRGQGIGKLVGLAKPDNHGIAIHYSYPSIHAAWIVDGTIEEKVVYRTSSRTLQRFNDNRDGWVKILKDAGLQFDFIAYSDIEKGQLISRGYKTLVLPMSLALSDVEVEAIREFVEQGGTVISDALPGVMDERSSFREDRGMEAVFGIRSGRVTRDVIVAMEGEPELVLQGAQALESDNGKPVLIEHRLGEGRTFLLNYFLKDYPDDKREGRNGPALGRMKKLLATAGIGPKVLLTTIDGESVSGCASYLFENGTTQLFGLVPDKDREGRQVVRVRLEGEKSIYDVRQSRLVGSGAVFEDGIEPAVPKLFAFVDGRVQTIEVEAPAEVSAGEAVSFEFRLTGVPQYRSVATVSVIDSSGQERSYYGGNTDIVNSSGTVQFRTALDDPGGAWKVLVRDTISGVQSEVPIKIRGRQVP